MRPAPSSRSSRAPARRPTRCAWRWATSSIRRRTTSPRRPASTSSARLALEELALRAVPAPDRAVAGEVHAAAPLVDAARTDAVDRADERFAAARGDRDVDLAERVG